MMGQKREQQRCRCCSYINGQYVEKRFLAAYGIETNVVRTNSGDLFGTAAEIFRNIPDSALLGIC